MQPAVATRNPLAAATLRSPAARGPPLPPPAESAPQQRAAFLRAQVAALRTRVDALQQAKLDSIDWRATGYSRAECTSAYDFRLRARLNDGHAGRLTALAWAGDNATLASVATDGMLVLWNAVTGGVDCVAELPGAELPTCVDVERSREDGLVVVGGLNHVCHVYALHALRASAGAGAAPRATLPGAGAYISAARVVSHERVLTASGDGALRAWDLTTRQQAAVLDARAGPALCAAVLAQDSDVCASGGADGRLRVWDARLPDASACVLSFCGLVGGVSAVDFFPSGTAVAGGGDDSTVRLFDLRACGPVGVYAEPRKRVGVTALAFSASGALLFAAYDDPVCIAWEPMSADGVLHELVGDFTRPVSCLAASGLALAAGGGDCRVRAAARLAARAPRWRFVCCWLLLFVCFFFFCKRLTHTHPHARTQRAWRAGSGLGVKIAPRQKSGNGTGKIRFLLVFGFTAICAPQPSLAKPAPCEHRNNKQQCRAAGQPLLEAVHQVEPFRGPLELFGVAHEPAGHA